MKKKDKEDLKVKKLKAELEILKEKRKNFRKRAMDLQVNP